MKIFTSRERTVVIILTSPFMVGMAVKVTKEHYNTGTDKIMLLNLHKSNRTRMLGELGSISEFELLESV